MVKAIWDEIGGTCVWEYVAVERAWGQSRRNIDAVIFPDEGKRSLRGHDDDVPPIRGRWVVAVQAKNTRLNLLLAGQAHYSRALLMRNGARYVRSIATCRVTDDLLEPLLAGKGVEVREVSVGRVGSASLSLAVDRLRAYHALIGGQLHIRPVLGRSRCAVHAVVLDGAVRETWKEQVDVADKEVTVISAPSDRFGMYSGGMARFGADIALALGARKARPVVLASGDDKVLRPILEYDGVEVVVRPEKYWDNLGPVLVGEIEQETGAFIPHPDLPPDHPGIPGR